MSTSDPLDDVPPYCKTQKSREPGGDVRARTHPSCMPLRAPQAREKVARRRRAKICELKLACASGTTVAAAIAASVAPPKRDSSCMSTRDEPRLGSQQTERLSAARWPAAGGWWSRCIGRVIPSVVGRHTDGWSVVLSLSSPKVDRRGRQASADAGGGGVRGLRT